MGRPAQLVSEIVHGKKEITRETAAQLGAAFGTGPEEWLELQNAYFLGRMELDPAVQRRLGEIRARARAVVIVPPPAKPVYTVRWSEQERKYVATVDMYPQLRASARSEAYAERKLRHVVAVHRRGQGPGRAGGKDSATRRL